MLSDWYHIVEGVRHGFNVGASPPPTSTYIFKNHASSNAKPEFIDEYIDKERTAGRYLGPFTPQALEQLIGPFRTSPLGLVPKSTPGAFRMIQDMSFPRNDPNISSVNAGIDSDAFPTEWGSFSSLSELILSLPTGCVAAAFDISAAYRITPITPSQQMWFCVHWRERLYLDLAVAFGMASSAGVFGSIADMLVAIYRKAGFRPNSQVGRRFLCHTPARPNLEGRGFHEPYREAWCPMEQRETEEVRHNAEIHWFPLGPQRQDSQYAAGQARQCLQVAGQMARSSQLFLCIGRCPPAWKACTHCQYFSAHPPFPSLSCCIRPTFPFPPRETVPKTSTHGRSQMGSADPARFSKLLPSSQSRPSRLRVVGGRQYILWDRCGYWWPMGHLEVVTQHPCRPRSEIRHWMGRGHSCRARFTSCLRTRTARTQERSAELFLSSVRQLGNRLSHHQRSVEKSADKRSAERDLSLISMLECTDNDGACHICPEHIRQPLTRGHRGLPGCIPVGPPSTGTPTSHTFKASSDAVLVAPVHSLAPVVPPVANASAAVARLELRPSPLRPQCKAEERLFLWIGVNRPPKPTINHPAIETLAALASCASLKDAMNYGAGLRKYHIFCDTFSIPEAARLPASFSLLHSFALWASATPELLPPEIVNDTQLEPIAVTTTRKYLSAVRAWHIAQGWPAPLSEEDHNRINWSLRGLERLQAGRRSRPPRPPITLRMMTALKLLLKLDTPFEACLWAIATCSFWGMMRFGEVTVKSRAAFNGNLHLKRSDVVFGNDDLGKPYARLDLPAAKTAQPGKIQSVFLVAQGDLCPLAALCNLFQVVPARASDPLFSWRDSSCNIRPMNKSAALDHLNSILSAWGWGNAFGHSFRIGGASFYLAQKVDPEIVRLAGRWKSLAYETYIRAFEQTASQHLGNIRNRAS